MTDTITGKFHCPTCDEQITWPDDATDETPITCKTCDVTFGTYGELVERFRREAKEAVMKKLRRGFGGGWKFS